MKNTLSILLVIISFGFVFSQNYHKFPESNAFWNYKITGSYSYPYEWSVLIELGQQTTIGSHQYTEVYWNSQGNSDILGAIRQDTVLKRVYFHNFTNEIVLYDFTLDVGDTIHYTTNLHYTTTYYKVVDIIDTISINGSERKIWYLTNSLYSMPDIWIEGIGSIYRYGLLYPNDPDIILDGSTPHFGCFAHDTITYINSTVCSGSCPCSGWLVNNNDPTSEAEISIFPNPAKTYIITEIPEKLTNQDIELYIYNQEGREVIRNKLSSTRNQMEISMVQSGVYTVQIRTETELITKKLIVY